MSSSRALSILALVVSLTAASSALGSPLSPEVRAGIAIANQIRTVQELEVLIRYDRPGCQASVSKTLSALEAYALAASRGEAEIDDRYRELTDAVDANPGCRSASQKALLIGSLFVLDPINLKREPIRWWTRCDGDPKRPDLPEICKGRAEAYARSYNLPLVFVAAELINRGQIRLLTEHERQARARLNPIWSERGHGDGAYRIQGTYSCADTVIWIDPSLRPLNLAGVLIHELDHLFRDKHYLSFRKDPESDSAFRIASEQEQYQYLLKDFGKVDGTVDWKALIRTDELSAIFTSAAHQLWFLQNFTPVAGDLSLVEEKGPLASFFTFDITLGYGTLSGTLFTRRATPGLGYRKDQLADSSSPTAASYRTIQDRVNQAYFGGASLPEDFSIAREIERGDDFLISLGTWQTSPSLQVGEKWNEPLVGWQFISRKYGEMIMVLKWVGYEDSAKMLRSMQTLMDTFDGVSNLCRWTIAQSRDQLRDYLGVQLASGPGRPGGDGVKGGGDGVKGTDSLVRACLLEGSGI